MPKCCDFRIRAACFPLDHIVDEEVMQRAGTLVPYQVGKHPFRSGFSQDRISPSAVAAAADSILIKFIYINLAAYPDLHAMDNLANCKSFIVRRENAESESW